MPNQQKRAPLSVRLPEELEKRLRQHAEDAGMPVNAVVCRAVKEHLDTTEKASRHDMDT